MRTSMPSGLFALRGSSSCGRPETGLGRKRFEQELSTE